MKGLKLIAAVLSMCLAVFAVGYKLAASSRNHVANRLNDSPTGGEVARDLSKLAPPAISGYRIDDLKIAGDLTLNGVTRPITIPTRVTLTGNDLRAQGEFSIDRSDFKVKATSAFHGLVRVRSKVKFEFDIVGHRSSS